MRHRGWIGVLLLSFANLHIGAAQGPASPGSARQTSAAPPTVLTARSRLVVEAVTVQDRNQHPVHGLLPADFLVRDNHHPQHIRHFEEHTAAAEPAVVPQLPPLPPGTYTNYTPAPPGGALTVLLLDVLNTSLPDQIYVRQQLQQFANSNENAGRIAIFSLTNRVSLLQSFTNDPRLLRDALAQRAHLGNSPLLDDPAAAGSTSANADNLLSNAQADRAAEIAADSASAAPVTANLSQIEAGMNVQRTEVRIQYTLDGFDALAHYLGNFPGRKNVIWFSGSFPLNFAMGADASGHSVTESNNEELAETTRMLSDAQVSVYPVDARGLTTNPIYDASTNPNWGRDPRRTVSSLVDENRDREAAQQTMEQIAEDTGGVAFYNTNGLIDAVRQTIAQGSDYYTLAYSPPGLKEDGSSHSVHIELAGALAAKGYKLAYRRIYLARRADPVKGGSVANATANLPAASAYERAALAFGGPAEQDILFRADIAPATAPAQESLAEGNRLAPDCGYKGSFRTLEVRFMLAPSDLHVAPQTDGRFTDALEFLALMYDRSGKLIDSNARRVDLNLNAETLHQLQSGPVRFRLSVSAPTAPGTFLHLAVHELPTGHFGTLDLPVGPLLRLSPLAAAPPAAPSKAP